MFSINIPPLRSGLFARILGLGCDVVAFSINILPLRGCASAHSSLFSTNWTCVRNLEKNEKCFGNRASTGQILSKLQYTFAICFVANSPIICYTLRKWKRNWKTHSVTLRGETHGIGCSSDVSDPRAISRLGTEDRYQT